MNPQTQPSPLEVGYEIAWSGGLGASGQNFSLAAHVESQGLKTLEQLKTALHSIRKDFDHKNLYRDFTGEISDGASLTELAQVFLNRIKKSGDFKIHRLELRSGLTESAKINF